MARKDDEPSGAALAGEELGEVGGGEAGVGEGGEVEAKLEAEDVLGESGGGEE